MLYVIQKGYNGVKLHRGYKIVYCVSSIDKIIESAIPFIYTDGHATDSFTTFYNPNNIQDIETQLDFNAINSTFWKDENDLDLKRRKEAELLLANDLPPNFILGYVVLNELAKQELVKIGIPETKIAIRKNYYYD